MLPDTTYICYHAAGFVLEREPLYVISRRRASARARVFPGPVLDAGRLQTLRQKSPHNLIAEGQHAAVAVMNHKSFFRS